MKPPERFRRLSSGGVRLFDSFGMWTQATTLEPGHPLRGNRCMFCGLLIAGRPCRFVVVIVAGQPSCECGQIPTGTQLICADHGTPCTDDLVRALQRLADVAHPEGGPQCRG